MIALTRLEFRVLRHRSEVGSTVGPQSAFWLLPVTLVVKWETLIKRPNLKTTESLPSRPRLLARFLSFPPLSLTYARRLRSELKHIDSLEMVNRPYRICEPSLLEHKFIANPYWFDHQMSCAVRALSPVVFKAGCVGLGGTKASHRLKACVVCKFTGLDRTLRGGWG
jgi:hypothetical protein